MPITNVTANREYQLPAGPNFLSDDVSRLIAALSAIDVDVASLLAGVSGRALLVHTHTISDVTGLATALSLKQDLSARGVANGYASLDSGGKVPTSQLPAAVLGAMSYQGAWNANTNTPTIPAAVAGNKGHYYKVATAGTTTISGVAEWAIGDWVVSNGTTWDKIDNTDQVTSVAGKMGAVTLVKGDVGLGNVDNTSDANKPISAAVATAIEPMVGIGGGVGGRLAATSLLITDWDTALNTGFYRSFPAGVLNAPIAGETLVGIVLGNANNVTQIVWPNTGTAADTNTWRRVRLATVWSSWQRMRWSETELDTRYARTTTTRRKFVADETFYVRNDGNDANDGKSNTSGGAWLTFGKAVEYAEQNVDLGGFDMIVQMGAPDTYTSGINSTRFINGRLIVRGDTASPSTYIWHCTNGDVVTADRGARIRIEGVELRTTTGGYGILTREGGCVEVGLGVRFGACANYHMAAIGTKARITFRSNYTIAGGAPVHMYAEADGEIECQGKTVTLVGTPAFTYFVEGRSRGLFILTGNTYSGSATGARFRLSNQAMIYALGSVAASYLPGNAAGTQLASSFSMYGIAN